MGRPAKGVYLLFVSASGRARVGRLGEQQFDGSYVYVGSARGPGGMRRLQRNYEVAQGLQQVCSSRLTIAVLQSGWTDMVQPDPETTFRVSAAYCQRPISLWR